MGTKCTGRLSQGHRVAALLGLVVLLLLVVSAVQAQGDGYDLSWWTVDGGGATFSTGSGYSLGGTAGQGDTGTVIGGGYTLNGGFWGAPGAQVLYRIYLPVILRNQ